MWKRLTRLNRRSIVAKPVNYNITSSDPPRWEKEMGALNALAFPDWEGRDTMPPTRKGYVWVMARAQGRGALVGYAFAYWLDGPPEEVDSILEQVAVHPQWRGRGIGRQLVSEVAVIASSLGRQRLGAVPLVGPDEERRSRWIRSLGFHSPWDRGFSATPEEVRDAIKGFGDEGSQRVRS